MSPLAFKVHCYVCGRLPVVPSELSRLTHPDYVRLFEATIDILGNAGHVRHTKCEPKLPELMPEQPQSVSSAG